MRAIDMRRRKSPITFDAVLDAQWRFMRRNGQSGGRILMRPDQREQFYALLRKHVYTPEGKAAWYENYGAGDDALWNGFEFVAREGNLNG